MLIGTKNNTAPEILCKFIVFILHINTFSCFSVIFHF